MKLLLLTVAQSTTSNLFPSVVVNTFDDTQIDAADRVSIGKYQIRISNDFFTEHKTLVSAKLYPTAEADDISGRWEDVNIITVESVNSLGEPADIHGAAVITIVILE